MPKNSEYWKKRMEALEEDQYQKSRAYYEDVKEQFDKAASRIQADIERWYFRLADNNEISYSKAKKLLKKGELEEFQWTVEEYIRKGEENAVNEQWIKELENASARYHINYLESIKLQLQQHAEVLFSEFEKGMTQFLKDTFSEQFYRTAFEISKGIGVGIHLAQIHTAAIDLLIKKPWAQDGKAFSDRIWENKEKLIRELHTELTQNVIRGESPRKAIGSLAKKMDVSKSQAGRLIMTESAAISSEARKECFDDLDVERYQFVGTLDGKTCEVCGSMDGKVFQMPDYEIGVTANPIHPNCRCCTAPYYDDWEEFGIKPERIARDPLTGKTYKVPYNMDYQEWKNQFARGTLEETTDKWSKEAKKELLLDEHALSVRKKEIAVIYDSDGKFLFQKRGSASEITFNWSEWKRLKGSIISHNHPSGSSFSRQDILTLFKSKAVEIRVATESGTYYMRAPQKWPEEINTSEKIAKEIEKISVESRGKYQQLYKSGKISKVDRYHQSIHEINSLFAERYGLDYGKEEFESNKS